MPAPTTDPMIQALWMDAAQEELEGEASSLPYTVANLPNTGSAEELRSLADSARWEVIPEIEIHLAGTASFKEADSWYP